MNESGREQFTWLQAITWALAIIAIFASSILMAGEADDADEKRTSVSSYFSDNGREQSVPDKVSKDDSALLAKSDQRSKTDLRSTQAGVSANNSATPNIDFWFYSADVVLFADNDRDGFFSGIDLLFDADTYYARAEVYAVVYLSLEGGVWTEYAATEDFVINGTSGNDEYVIVTDLVSGYPAGSYDILIELFDAHDHSFVADMGPEHTSELAFLPLEDAGRDAPAASPPPVVVSHGGGGGATDVWTLAMLTLFAAGSVVFRRRRLLCSELRHLAKCREPSA